MVVELLGILSSIFVLISFSMDGEVKIRIINIIGAMLFVIYGLCIHSFSVWFLNFILILIHYKKLLDISRC